MLRHAIPQIFAITCFFTYKKKISSFPKQMCDFKVPPAQSHVLPLIFNKNLSELCLLVLLKTIPSESPPVFETTYLTLTSLLRVLHKTPSTK